ncbi:Helix-turn-helix domain-containing protein [Salegentibacter holothuriorum]|uniref:Helix-turn-helix domain-containing protein n=1 Tax=Salegentibacter holothuriorum TaxID=241145 RepID=A0A1T5AKG6_9FLAO|nr:AraC family transcriptional regulator [Salegentibacter holothuriorum]SKB35436.1 Helix-turn-helix domain-containing protein [Salegentibacter holothuriorum]
MFHFDRNFGLFIGKLPDNNFHKHYAMQISVSGNSNMSLLIKNGTEISGNAFFLNSKVAHRLKSENNQLTILINPLNSTGHQFYLTNQKLDFVKLENSLSKELIAILLKFESSKVTFESLCTVVSNILYNYKCACESERHFKDNRILTALKYMDDNFERVLSLEEVSEKCFLSATRFLHLFKEKTNLSFRRYQLWNKVIKSLPYLMQHSVTETAYTFGFSDSSHYTRTFKETFGETPKFLFPKQ